MLSIFVAIPVYVYVIAMLIAFVAVVISDMLPYELYVKIAGSILLVLITAAWTYSVDEKSKQLAVAEAKAEAQRIQAESNAANVQVVTKYLTKIQVVKEAANANERYIDRVITKYDESCPIPPAVVEAHNSAAVTPPGEAQ
jgi:energy-coupling factor transporter transmembrane protein EcfT